MLPGMPSIGDMVSTVIGKFAEMLWGIIGPILASVFSWIDKSTEPTIIYTPDGPLAKVYPITLWIGGFLVVAFGFAQIGLTAINGTRSLFALLKGTAQYLLLSGSSLTILSVVSSLASLAATGIISAGFNVDSWSGLSEHGDFGQKTLNGVTGIALLIVVVFNAVPFTFGLLVEMMIRQGAMEVLATTFPIIAAGLVHEKFARWYWTGVRWMLALIFMLPVLALSMVIGHSIAQGAGSAAQEGLSAQVMQALVGGFVSIIGLLFPYFLFKLFAFVDPNTVSGANFRASLPQGKKGGGGEDTEGAAQASEGASDSGAGATDSMSSSSGGSAAGSGGAGAAGSGGGGGAAGGASGAGAFSGGGVMAALGAFSAAATSASEQGATQGHASLDSAGAGHRSQPGGSSGGGERGAGSRPSADDGSSDDQAGRLTGPSGTDSAPTSGGGDATYGDDSYATDTYGGSNGGTSEQGAGSTAGAGSGSGGGGADSAGADPYGDDTPGATSGSGSSSDSDANDSTGSGGGTGSSSGGGYAVASEDVTPGASPDSDPAQHGSGSSSGGSSPAGGSGGGGGGGASAGGGEAAAAAAV